MAFFDFIVVGAGPNGLYSAFTLKNLFPQRKVIVLDEIGICGNISKYPDVVWHSTMSELKLPSILNNNIPENYHPISSELVKYYKAFAHEHQIDVLEEYKVTKISQIKNVRGEKNSCLIEVVVLHNEQKHIFLTSKVILATGVYQNPRKLSINNSDFIEYGYSTKLENKNLLLIGAGNSAIDFIIHLLPKNQITWVFRKNHWNDIFYSIKPIFNQVFHNFSKNITILPSRSIVRIENKDNILLDNGEIIGGFDSCHALLGYTPAGNLSKSLNILTVNESLELDKFYQTTLFGVYAFGSVMASWNNETNELEQTFIHNGNPNRLKVITDHIKCQEIKDIFNFDRRDLVEESQYSSASSIELKNRLRNFFKLLLSKIFISQ